MSLQNEFGFTPGGSGFQPLKEGDYDAVLHGIVGLGIQKGSIYQGEQKPPVYKFKFIFEVPSEERGEDKLPATISKSINLSNNVDRGGFALILKSLGVQVNKNTIMSYATKDELVKLLGKSLQITVEQFTGDNGKAASYVKETTKLHPKVEKPAAVREGFYFNPRFPDLNVFNNTLTHGTKSQVMSALDADQFPTELHEAWVKAQEEQALKTAARETTRSDEREFNTGSIE